MYLLVTIGIDRSAFLSALSNDDEVFLGIMQDTLMLHYSRVTNVCIS
jgi:hypothetical protein